MLVEPLALSTPLSAFNGGLVVEPDMDVVEELVLPDELVSPTIELLESFELSTWVYQGANWFVRDLDGPHVAHESVTVQFEPTVVDDFAGLTSGVAKIVGVSDDHAAVAVAEAELRRNSSATTSRPRARSPTTST